MTVNAPLNDTPRSTWATSLAWVLAIAVSATSLFVWGQDFSWKFSLLSSYLIFPVLGLLAFGLMWAHYMTGEIRRLSGQKVDESFSRYTGYAVLVLLLLHPGLLIFQRFQDGFGLPPDSYMTYVAPSLAWLTILGAVSLLAFLAYELKRWFHTKKWWKYVLVANDLAMLAVFYHGLRLGSQIMSGWYMYVWWFLGLTLLASIVHSYIVRIQQHSFQAH